MPYGYKSEDHNQKNMNKQQKNTHNKIVRGINQEVKRRVQQDTKAQNNDGNKGKR